jgi:hypothetical protein
MCDCVEPPKGLAPAAPTLENAAEYKATYGEMVKVQYTSPFAPVSPITFRGAATRVNYGARAKDDIFFIWQADLDNSQDFTRVDDYMPPAQQTIVPAPPTVDEFTADAPATVTPPAPSLVAVEGENNLPADMWYSQDGQNWQNDARPGATIDSDPNANLTGQVIVDEAGNVLAQARSMKNPEPEFLPLGDMTKKQMQQYAADNNISIPSKYNTAEKIRKYLEGQPTA